MSQQSKQLKTAISVLSLALIFWCGISPAHATSGEHIDSFDTTLKMNVDASVDVREEIDYDFGAEQHHGIYREIPYKYQARGGNFSLRISAFQVTDASGAPYAFTVSDVGSDKEIEIGDPDSYVTGQKTYVISYHVQRAVNFLDSYDELYWNATGDEWKVPIEQASAQVIFPAEVPESQAQRRCFMGVRGSSQSCDSSDYAYVDAAQTSVNGEDFSASHLAAGEGLTVVAGIPKGMVQQPTRWQNFIENLRDNLILLLPLLVLLFMFFLWWTRGRDPQGRGTIIPEFDVPDQLTPAEVGTVVDEHCAQKEVVGEIIYLATAGYLKLRRTEDAGLLFKSHDYVFERLRDSSTLANSFDRDLLDAIFASGTTVKLSSLKKTFYKDYQRVVKDVFVAATEKGYFAGNPQKVMTSYLAVMGLLIVFLWLFASSIGGDSSIALLFSAIIIALFGSVMPRKTERGVLVKEHILGFKDYLTVAEKDRLEFHNAPEKSPQVFERFLPYAIALGVEKKWAGQFEGIYNSSPSWYEDTTGIHTFTALSLTHDLGNFSTAFTSGATAASGGGGMGGGFSGGGFGGGGGGSW